MFRFILVFLYLIFNTYFHWLIYSYVTFEWHTSSHRPCSYGFSYAVARISTSFLWHFNHSKVQSFLVAYSGRSIRLHIHCDWPNIEISTAWTWPINHFSFQSFQSYHIAPLFAFLAWFFFFWVLCFPWWSFKITNVTTTKIKQTVKMRPDDVQKKYVVVFHLLSTLSLSFMPILFSCHTSCYNELLANIILCAPNHIYRSS